MIAIGKEVFELFAHMSAEIQTTLTMNYKRTRPIISSSLAWKRKLLNRASAILTPDPRPMNQRESKTKQELASASVAD